MGTVLRRIERLLFTVAVLCLVYVVITLFEAAYYRAVAREMVVARPIAAVVGEESAPSRESHPAPPTASAAAPQVVPVTVPRPTSRRAVAPKVALIGALEIPHLKVSTAIIEGDTWQTLSKGAGHMPGTALPGEPGNVVLAGHRDTVFRRLGEIRRGDRLRVATPQGTFDYRVSRTLRVKPHDVWVLDANAAALTLVTCYPFTWVGSAPERWVVQAERDPADATD